MQVPGLIKRLFTIDDGILDEQFTLGDGDNLSYEASDSSTDADQREDRHGGDEASTADVASDGGTHGRQSQGSGAARGPVRPVPMDEWVARMSAPQRPRSSVPQNWEKEHLPARLEDVNHGLEEIFYLPDNKDIVLRAFDIGTQRRWQALVVFVDGLADKAIINMHILEPLMLLAHLVDDQPPGERMEVVKRALLPGIQVIPVAHWKEATDGILAGSTALFVDGCDEALLVETKGWEHRMVGLAQTETVVRGPHDAFTENFRSNTGLVRSKFRSDRLVTEMLSVGSLAKTDIAVMYVRGLTNPELVREVKRRVKGIDVDFLSDSGLLEQFIEDRPYMFVPQVMSTERPDRIAYMLAEGHVAIFVGHSSFVLAVPVVFWTLMQTAEDAYLRFPLGTLLRLMRWCALLIALLLPAFYISLTNYHPEMLPTDMMLAIAGSRELVPFPVVMEVMLMEFSIELIREAGIRIPSAIGPTIGIVGALILGQAAVQAGVVSPLLVIVIAVTALASFTIPNYNLNFGVRIWRFTFLVAAAFFGFYGIALLLCIVIARLSVQKSFGVPLLAPVAPSMDSSRDVLLRGPTYTMNRRPSYLHTLKSWRQQPTTRPWSPATAPNRQGSGQGNESSDAGDPHDGGREK